MLISTTILSDVHGQPETPAIYRSSGNRSNVVFGQFSFQKHEELGQNMPNHAKG
jgi:hypothetical protein